MLRGGAVLPGAFDSGCEVLDHLAGRPRPGLGRMLAGGPAAALWRDPSARHLAGLGLGGTLARSPRPDLGPGPDRPADAAQPEPGATLAHPRPGLFYVPDHPGGGADEQRGRTGDPVCRPGPARHARDAGRARPALVRTDLDGGGDVYAAGT